MMKRVIHPPAIGELDAFLHRVARTDRRQAVREVARRSRASLEGDDIVRLAHALAGRPAGAELNALIMGVYNVTP